MYDELLRTVCSNYLHAVCHFAFAFILHVASTFLEATFRMSMSTPAMKYNSQSLRIVFDPRNCR